MFFAMLPQHPGVYKISCLPSGKVYVGMSLNIRKRINQHFSSLKNNKHHNRHLQLAYKKYGKSQFIVSVLELVDEKELSSREQYWLTKLSAFNREIGYNSSETSCPGKCENFTKPKTYIVTQPSGEEVYVKNLTAFCRSLGWTHPDSRLHRVANGEANSYLGYTCRHSTQTSEQWLKSLKRGKRPGAKTKYLIIATHPDGKVEEVLNFSRFCQENQLSRGTAWSCITKPKVRKQHKGFKFKKQQIK